MGVLSKIWSYLRFWKPQESPTDAPSPFNLRAMHTINKISILMGLIALVVIIIKLAT